MALFCVALDIDSKEKFELIFGETSDFVDVYKIGPVILSSCGLEPLERLTQLMMEQL
jgi:orotidine-5'-phosphate decarboxylase